MKNVLKLAAASTIALSALAGTALANSTYQTKEYDHLRQGYVEQTIDRASGEILRERLVDSDNN